MVFSPSIRFDKMALLFCLKGQRFAMMTSIGSSRGRLEGRRKGFRVGNAKQ